MLYLIGIGLRFKDLSVRALEAIKKCDYIYLDNYTSILTYDLKDLENLIDKKIILADRDLVENKANEILNKSKQKDVAFLVIGDVFSATTHISLLMDAAKNKIKYEIIHGISILTAIGDTGLSLYNFGKVSSIPKNNENVETPYDILKQNKGSHTLFLLDIGMSINEGIKFLLNLEKKRKENVFGYDVLCVGCAGLGSGNAEIKVGKAMDVIKFKFKANPQCLIVPGKLHFVEEEFLERFK